MPILFFATSMCLIVVQTIILALATEEEIEC
jgi:hypothetical protein